MKYTYLLINFGSILVPFMASFDKRLALNKNFKALFSAIAATGTFFLIWDIVFTHWGVWGFNPIYLSGIYFFDLPLGEWLFFISIPFACVFTYVALGYLIKVDLLKRFEKSISMALIFFMLFTVLIFHEKLYTATTFLLTAAFIAYLQFVERPTWLSRFYLAYLFILIPFFLVNGILTGSFISQEIVWYNNTQNLGLRIGTIPIEDTFYGMLLILMNVYFFEKWKR